MSSNWKTYGVVTEVLVNEGSNVADLAVVANTGPSDNYPEARILIGSTTRNGVDGFAISVRKWRELERLVNHACDDITAACPAHGDVAVPLTRPEALRQYLSKRLEVLTSSVPNGKYLSDVEARAEAEIVRSFLRWMDEAGLGA